MIDIKFLRENPEIVKQNIKNKFQEHKLHLVDEVIELDAQARAAQQEADELRSKKNKIAKQIGALMGQGKKEEAEAVKADGCRYFCETCGVRAGRKSITGKGYTDHDEHSEHH